MSDIKVRKIDEVYNRFECDAGIAQEISDYFTFTVPGYKFMPAFRNGSWDGKIRLANPYKKALYGGLLWKLDEFARVREYDIDIENVLLPKNFSRAEAIEFAARIGLPEEYITRDHQIDAFVHSVRYGRALLLSPTSSGKSLIIYLLAKYYELVHDLRSLIIVPSTGLVKQMTADFIEYGADPDWIHGIMAGKTKDSDRTLTVSTWQSVVKMPGPYFKQFGMIMVDEAHLAKAKSITGIMEKATETEFRFGCTGTLDGSLTHELVTTGLFGPVLEVIKTKEMQEKGFAARTKIKIVVLKWGDQFRQALSKATYADEIKWVATHPARNKFLKNLALSLDGNVLLLFNFKEQGEALVQMLRESGTTKDIHFIDGGVKTDVREEIRLSITSETESITVASLGTTSTGISVKDFNYLIFGHPSKGRIRNLQSIGRLLRVSKKKNYAEIIDVADDLSWKTKKNHGLNHLAERIKQYESEEHPFKLYPVDMS